jgi:hypothetical protein
MLAVAERLARPKAERFDRPLRDGRVFFASFPSPAAAGYWAFTESLPPSPRRRFAVARPFRNCGRAVAQRAKAASGLRRTSPQRTILNSLS